MRLVDLSGKKFGFLKVISMCEERRNKKVYYNCVCDCGSIKQISGAVLLNKSVVSCGCNKANKASIRMKEYNKNNLNCVTHGHTFKTTTKTYTAWLAMKARCTNPKAQNYKWYGGRGIKVCDRWLHSFENFLEDMKEKPNNLELDRIDVNGNYEPSNCRWVTRTENMMNRRRSKGNINDRNK